MSDWTSSMRAYLDGPSPVLERMKARHLLIAEAELAASWGVPDNESIGYSQADLCSIIRKLVNYIKEH